MRSFAMSLLALAAAAVTLGSLVTPATAQDGAVHVTFYSGGNDGANATDPCWSPCGGFIAYDDRARVFVIPATGGTPTQVTTGGGTDPHWSPDGSQLAFESSRDGTPNIYTIDVGFSTVQVTSWGKIKAMYR